MGNNTKSVKNIDYILGQQGSGVFGRNYVINPSAFESTNNVTVANSATVTRNTTTPITAISDFSITMPNNATGTVTWALNTLDNGMKNHASELVFDYTASSIGSNVVFQILNGATVVATSSALAVNTSTQTVSLAVSAGDLSSATTIVLANGSGNTGTSAINVANITYGKARSVGVLNQITSWANDLTFTTNGFGTITGSNFWYRREGDSMRVRGSFTCGTSTAVTAYIQLPAGYTLDTTKLNTIATTGLGPALLLRSFNLYTAGVATEIFYDGSTNNQVFLTEAASSNVYTKQNGSAISASGDNFSFDFLVPISGWSTVSIINSGIFSNPITDFVAYTPTLTGFGTGTPPTNLKFKYARVGDSIVIEGTFTNGDPNGVEAQITLPTGLTSASDYPTLQSCGYGTNNHTGGDQSFLPLIEASKTYLTFGKANSGVAGLVKQLGTAWAINDVQSFTARVRIAGYGSSQIQVAPSGSVTARYFASATTISSSLATINWTTKDYDSDSAMSSGTYTVPTGKGGQYQVNTALLITGTIALNNSMTMEIQKNGTVVSRYTDFFPPSITDGKAMMSDIINCVGGDTLRVQFSTTVTAPSIVSSNFDNYISIARVGSN